MVIPGIKGMSLRQFAKLLYREISDHAVTDTAAQLSYYLLFSLFPFLFFLVTLSAYLPLTGPINDLLDRASWVMPDQALDVLTSHLQALLQERRQKLLTLGLVTTIWSASRGVDALRKSLNLAYSVTESRPFWKTQGAALLMTVAVAVLIPLAIALFALGSKAGIWVAHELHVDEWYHLVWVWIRWPLTALVVMLAAALGYYFLPDVEQEFKFITPGSVLGSVSWLLATWGFTQYVGHFGKYNITYGSIGGVVLLMLWLYIGGLIFLIGGEINAIIEHASEEGKAKGARAAGEPPPTPAGAPAISPGAAKRAETGRRFWWQLWRRRPVQSG